MTDKNGNRRKLKLPITLLFTSFSPLCQPAGCDSDKPQARMPARYVILQALFPCLAASSSEIGSRTGPDSEQASQSAPKPRSVVYFIANAEKEYMAAKRNSRLEICKCAKRGFDRAVDELLKAPPEIRADERVQHELERVLEAVNRPETAVGQSGTAATEPAPIDGNQRHHNSVDPQREGESRSRGQGHTLRNQAPTIRWPRTSRIPPH